VLGALTLAIGAWLLMSLGSARAERRAFVVGFSPERVAGERLERGLADAADARRMTTDAPARLLEWRLLWRARPRDEANDRVLLRVVRDEPENYEAWFYLARTTRDAELRRRARARLSRLGPALP
jgi:hypothetical protein